MANTNSNTDKLSLNKTLDERKLAILKAQEARDKVFKLMVKIISWETDSLNSLAVKSLNKITASEWLNYKKHALGVPTSESIDKIKEKITQTYKNIKANGGFK